MSYLRLYDYELPIQDAQLSQLKNGNENVRLVAEAYAQAKMISHLKPKYDVKNEFTDTTVFNITTTYKANSLVELNADSYDVTLTYALNRLTLESGKVYICSTAITVPEVFTVVHWTLLGDQYDLFFVPLPYQNFDIKQVYLLGDIVFCNDKLYKCLIATITPDHNSDLQHDYINQIGNYNIFPDDKINGAKYWGVGIPYNILGLKVSSMPTDFTAWSNSTPYSVGIYVNYNNGIWQCLTANTNKTPGSDITNWQPVSWLAGDNRCLEAVQNMLDIAIWSMHKRIAPKNIPELRIRLNDDAMEWLEQARKGDLIIDMPEMQPVLQGSITRFGGKVKNINSY